MSVPDKTAPCVSPGCPNLGNCARGLCYGHYRRLMRGKPVDTPLRAKGDETVELPGTRVPKEVYLAIETEAEARGISIYAMEQVILNEWFAGGSDGKKDS